MIWRLADLIDRKPRMSDIADHPRQTYFFPDMTAARRFSGPELEELAKAKILGVRAGAEHRGTRSGELGIGGFAYQYGTASDQALARRIPP